MTCNCVCTCPFEAGDTIRFKLEPDSLFPNIRTNGGLDLTLLFYGKEYVIYEWRDRGTGYCSGESMLSRADFDEKVEKAPPGWQGD